MNGRRHAFITAMAMLVKSGCTIRESLEAMETIGDFSGEYARKTLRELERGNGVTAALRESGLRIDAHWNRILSLFEKTGSIAEGLALMKDGIESSETRSSRLAGALIYPASAVAIAICGCIALLVRGIPMIASSGIRLPTETIAGMKSGIAIAIAGTIVGSTLIAVVTALFIRRAEMEYAFWSMTHELSKSGIALSVTVSLCAPLFGNHCVDEDFRYSGVDPFITAMLNTARRTGDYVTAANLIAQREKAKSETVYELVERAADPVVTALAGAIIVILAVTVFLPLLSFQGGFQ